MLWSGSDKYSDDAKGSVEIFLLPSDFDFYNICHPVYLKKQSG